MKTEIIKSGDNATARVYQQNFDYDLTDIDKKRLVLYLSKDITETSIGYAGFSTKAALHDYLMGTVFGEKESDNEIFKLALDREKIIKAIKKAVIPCSNTLPSGTVHIFIFPTFSRFVKERMSGTTGYTPWKNTILVFVNPLNQRWEKALVGTVSHEFNHSVFLRYNKCESLLDSMIFEGLAEHFREQTVGGERAPWTKVLDLKQSKGLLVEMKSEGMLQSTDKNVYRAVFFGNEKYTLWTGYTIGYFIITSFFNHYPTLLWKETMTMSPRDIFTKSGFLK